MNGPPLPPWKRLPAFNLPRESTFNLNVTTPVRIAKGDPMRAALIIGIGGVSNSSMTISYPIPIAFGTVTITSAIPNAVVSTDPGVTTSGGLVLNPVLGPLIIDYPRWGALVQQPWYAVSLGSGPLLTVIELSMMDWPESPALPDPIAQLNGGKYADPFARRARRNGRVVLYGNRWREWPAPSPYSLPDEQ